MKNSLILFFLLITCSFTNAQNAYFGGGLQALHIADNSNYISNELESKFNLALGFGIDASVNPFNTDRPIYFFTVGLNYFKLKQGLSGGVNYEYADVDHFEVNSTEYAQLNVRETMSYALFQIPLGVSIQLNDSENFIVFADLAYNLSFVQNKKYDQYSTNIIYSAKYSEYGTDVFLPGEYVTVNEVIVENGYGKYFDINRLQNYLESKNPASISFGINLKKQISNESYLKLNASYHYFLKNRSLIESLSNFEDINLQTIMEGNQQHESELYNFRIEDPEFVLPLRYNTNAKLLAIQFGLSYNFMLE